MQRVIVEALGELGDPAAIPTLARLLDHRDQALRTRVMRALQRLTGESLGSNRERWRSWLREHGHLQD
jgi:HEAT repeat protein